MTIIGWLLFFTVIFVCTVAVGVTVMLVMGFRR
jgi:hypothetical protein